jgi:Domain of unknown function (DUF4396)
MGQEGTMNTTNSGACHLGGQEHRHAAHAGHEDHTGHGNHGGHAGHQSHHAHHGGDGGPLKLSAQATLHCLTGCVIGEVAGLMIGVSLGWSVGWTIALATTLAYISGLALGVVPVARNQGISLWQAFRIIWLGEVISIGVMEIAMNVADYSVGGMQTGSIMHPMFWFGIVVAVPAGFLAAWPVNWWLLKRNMKQCH